MTNRFFSTASFDYLSELAKNNNREWFQENKDRYETSVREPALAYIEYMAQELPLISPHFLALPKKVGGSLMRVHRDVRFSKNKQPYKTNIGIQFRHEVGKDVHAPGYYVHIEPGDCFLGVGMWRPDSPSLRKIREAIDDSPKQWNNAKKVFDMPRRWKLVGDSLVNPPRGYAKDHPMLEDLKRKDFIAVIEFPDKKVVSKSFRSWVCDAFQDATPFMCFLCQGLEIRF